MFEYAGIVRTGQPRQSLVTVETNVGGDILLTAVREALGHLDVQVRPVVHAGGTPCPKQRS